jgi:hypothetical protein
VSGRPQEIFIDEHCIGCKYYADIANYIYYCSYYEKEDKLRPCPPGKDCTERKEKVKDGT